ncbi:hypothetical protein [Halomonas ventosae]|uniref:Mor transcription activator family protein n=1 Tax=Halomonas ventosae TaxID=229007 RepID=A0A2T0VL96_9GAMM|nr:hypothetical protein [Halomonas ventosae]PRY70996.1 hypothetical protein BCL64_11097 [Halomonas ventosae]
MKIHLDRDAEADARSGRQTVRLLADKLEAGEELKSLERQFLAGVLRAAADSIQAPRRQGPPSKLPDGDQAAIEFALLVNQQGYSRTQAREEIADKYEVSVEAVRKHLKKDCRGERALAFVRVL